MEDPQKSGRPFELDELLAQSQKQLATRVLATYIPGESRPLQEQRGSLFL